MITKSRRLALTAAALAVLATLTAGKLIGSDVSGCPSNISAQACAEETR